ncbi:YncE family protein [Edaphobacter aggregans]|nr:YncE family protein [Edaphobacter aggregans]
MTVSMFALAVAGLASITGCGNTYRPVVTAINPVGPAAQPQKFAIVVSTTGTTSPGLATIVDFAGDTVLITASIGVSPYYFATNAAGNTGYTLNGDGSITSFDISTSLLSSQVLQTTLIAGANPVSIFPQSTNSYIPEPGRNAVAVLLGTPPALKQELPIAAGFSPVYVVGNSTGSRAYSINQAVGGGNGQVAAIETTSNTLSSTIPVGATPVYGVMTADGKRAFIMNQGDNTVSVLNVQTNALDVVPAGATNPIKLIDPQTGLPGTAPLWADFALTRNELVVANAGSGNTPGTVSIINIPLCNATALPTNPNCDPTNPADATGFGQVLANIPVGLNPRMVAVLSDATRAYVVNQGDSTVSVVNLTTNTVTKTIPVPATIHPNFIAVIAGTPTGKVYVTSPESETMTVIRTDTDVVDTTIPLQGKGVMVRTQP